MGVLGQVEELLRAASDESVQLVLHQLQLLQRRQERERVPPQKAADRTASPEHRQFWCYCFTDSELKQEQNKAST